MKGIATETKILIGIFLGTILLIGGALFFFSKQPTANSQVYTQEQLVLPTTQIKGNTSSPIYLVEFSDFQCPACGTFEPLVQEIMKQHGDKIAFGYRHFPLTQHEFADEAARASIAAGKQNKFWEYHDLLFENQEQLSPEKFIELATQLELNIDQFTQDKESQETKDIIQKDMADGNAFDVNSTPTFFLNGKKLILRSGQDLVNAVNEALNQ